MRTTRTLIALAVAIACSTAAHATTDGTNTQSIATDPLLRRAFVTSLDTGMLTIIDLDRMSLLATRPAGRVPRSILSNAASSRLYVLDDGTPAAVNVLDAGGDSSRGFLSPPAATTWPPTFSPASSSSRTPRAARSR